MVAAIQHVGADGSNASQQQLIYFHQYLSTGRYYDSDLTTLMTATTIGILDLLQIMIRLRKFW